MASSDDVTLILVTAESLPQETLVQELEAIFMGLPRRVDWRSCAK